MAIQGNAYTKTAWSFEERPVASSKLNAWDDQIEGALELAYLLLNEQWGGRDGVVRGAMTDDLKILASSPVSMAVNVGAGYALISGMPYKQAVQAALPSIATPITNPRIDLVQAKLDGWGVEVKTGVESATPVVPTLDTDAIALAEIYLLPGMSSIKDTQDGVNGYIVDTRPFL